jgi:hypothetical protein
MEAGTHKTRRQTVPAYNQMQACRKAVSKLNARRVELLRELADIDGRMTRVLRRFDRLSVKY